MVFRKGPLLAVLFFACLPLAAAAQTPPKNELGRIQQRFQVPPESRARPAERIQPLAVPGLPRSGREIDQGPVKFTLRALHVTGSTVYDDEAFRPFYAEFLGREVTLEALLAVSKRITKKYADDGYVISRASPPEKDPDADGVVTIRVIEGYIEKVEWPETITRYRDFFSDYAAKITADRPLNIRTLQHYLDTSDLPGLSFSYKWKPLRASVGAYVLIVTVKEKHVDITIRIDNRATTILGPDESVSQVAFNNIFGQHESLTLSYGNAFKFGDLDYFAAKYRQVLNIEGLNFLLNGTYSNSRAGADLFFLNDRTRGTIFEAGMSYALKRSLERNLTFTGKLFTSDTTSSLLGMPLTADRLNGVRISLDGDSVDSLKGSNQWNITLSQGFKGLGSTQTGSFFASVPNGRADFTKVEGTISRTQPLTKEFSFYVSAYSQYGFNPELSPEQCGYGGRDFGRAFDPSQLFGDRCFMAIAELRYNVWDKASGYRPATQLFTFIDYGEVTFAQILPGFERSDRATSAGAGVRFDWEHVKTDFVVAKAIDSEHEHDWRFFFTVTLKN
ncbi:MAG TPA: ShlB/FhaC/HecB family hemolysin secretion/activation protein [Xanthobacteraceae bacterium]|nr:ShlB/FhaC/HecB family hemolysin secretion/activation protein [Xanthobacteraceae bacterium]